MTELNVVLKTSTLTLLKKTLQHGKPLKEDVGEYFHSPTYSQRFSACTLLVEDQGDLRDAKRFCCNCMKLWLD